MKHAFALHCETLNTLVTLKSVGTVVTLSESALVHRIVRVLRLGVGDTLTLFNKTVHAQITLKQISKKSITCTVNTCAKNQIYMPALTLVLPVLKKNNLEEAVYSACEMGATEIKLVFTEKTNRKWGGDKELERLRAIIISAAEQAKNFSYPELLAPVSFDACMRELHKNNNIKLYCAPGGHSLFDVIKDVRDSEPEKIIAMVGPEGDLTEEEKKLAQKSGFRFVALTPTILRARQAVVLITGVVRSLLGKNNE